MHAAFLAQQTALTAQKLAVEAALEAADHAVSKAEVSTDKRFESVNEFRATLADQQSTFMPRPEAMALLKSIEDKMAAQLTSHEKNYNDVVKALADIRLVISRLLQVEAYEKSHTELQRQVNDLRESRSEVSGKSSGANAFWGYLVAIAGIALVLVFHFVK